MAANFDGFKQKTGEAAEFVAAKSVQFAKFAAGKTKILAKSAKLNTEIMSEKDAVRRAQMELGKLYYETFKDEPHEPLAETCRRITNSLELIHAKREQLEALKKGEEPTVDDGRTELLAEAVESTAAEPAETQAAEPCAQPDGEDQEEE